MKKCINILLYAAFFGILAAQRPIQEYSTIHFNIYPIATYYILSVILGTLILLIRPKLVSPNLPLPDLLLQIAFIVVTTALFIWKFGSIRFLVLALLTEDVYTLIALLVRKRRRTPPEEPHLRLTFSAPSCTIDHASRPDSCGDKAKACS